MKKGSIIFIFLLFIIVGVLIYFMPDIYKKIQEMDTPKVEKNTDNTTTQTIIKKITMDSDIIKNLTIPIMHNDKYSSDSYYQRSEFSINDLTNNDILYNSFLDIYDGYLKDHISVGCATKSKEFSATYLKSRIKNIIGKNINYKLEDFNVPNIYKDTNYVGLWKYDSNNDIYVYNGNCNKIENNTIYYEISNLYKVDNTDDLNTLYLYYHIGFVKLEGNKYTIYKDENYQEEVSNGYMDNNFNYDLSNFKTYKYTYKLGLCTYDNYCFYKGEWASE